MEFRLTGWPIFSKLLLSHIALNSHGGVQVDWRAAAKRGEKSIDFCTSKTWLIEHMPPFGTSYHNVAMRNFVGHLSRLFLDLNFLPPSVSVNVTSMLDDVAAFAVMSDTLQVIFSSLSLV